MKRIHKWSFKYRKRPFGKMQIYHQLHALKLLGFTNKTVVKPNKMGILSASARARDSNANQHQTKSKLESKPYVRRSKLNSFGEVMASLHKAPYRYTQSQHPFHQLGRIAARRRGSRWGIGFLFLLRWYLQGNSNFYVITKADVDSFS
jgi:hypothetical protein